MSDYLWASHAKYRRPGPEKKYDSAYFRISLHRHKNNQQHQRLRTLSTSKPHTYYVAPEMPDLKVFNEVFLARQITNSSRLIPVSECKDYNDGEQHYITYQLGDTGFTEHSDPIRKEGSERGENIESLYRRTSGVWRPINEEFASGLFDDTRSIIEYDVRSRDRPKSERERAEDDAVLRVLDEEPARRTKQSLITRSAELASLYFGATLMLVGSRE